MEKLSSYNIFAPFANGYYILYNSYSGYYGLLTEEKYNYIIENKDNLAEFADNQYDLYLSLKNNSCIIDAEVDEFKLIKLLKFNKKFETDEYHIIINPTMDCNIGCWYCYENHKEGSKMSDDISSSIIRHLYLKFSKNHFRKLHLSFFGGEPLLQANRIMEIIEKADEFCSKNNIKLSIAFTTNGTVVSDKILCFLQKYEVFFQITLDGDKNRHNKIRNFKKSGKGSFDTVIDNLKRISETLSKSKIVIRINFDSDTLKYYDKILNSVDFLDRTKVSISLHRVWQVNDSDIDTSDILEFISEGSKRNFNVECQPLNGVRENICYADLINESLINYDGNVYKCTARDFSEENRDGVLTPSGYIIWDTNKLRERMLYELPERCVTCQLYPSCVGICSQHMIENKDNWECTTLKTTSLEDLIVFNFQQKYLQLKR